MSINKPRYFALIFIMALCACAGGLRSVDHLSPNQDDRVRFLVLHFTDEDFRGSLAVLTDAHSATPVSAHYLVSAPGDPQSQPTVYRLVDEGRRAWHAGQSQWQGRQSINDTSIGIEIVYRSHCPREAPSASGERAVPDSVAAADSGCAWPDYPAQQMATLIRLAREVLARHPQIEPAGVVGHADIAPGRKPDPGPRFPWRQLHDAGIGAWYEQTDVDYYGALAQLQPPSPALLHDALAAYGYAVGTSGEFDAPTRDALFAFQTHFLPDQRSGEVDVRSIATVLALLHKYRPAAMTKIESRYGIAALPSNGGSR